MRCGEHSSGQSTELGTRPGKERTLPEFGLEEERICEILASLRSEIGKGNDRNKGANAFSSHLSLANDEIGERVMGYRMHTQLRK